MKILQVCAYAAPYEGNFIKSLLALDNSMNAEGNETMYAFPKTAEGCDWVVNLKKQRKVFFLPLSKARLNPKTYYLLKKIICEEKIAIVHSHFELYDIPLSVVKPKNTKLFWHLHDAIENYYNQTTAMRKLQYKFHYKYFSRRAFLVSVSDKHKEFAIKLGMNKVHTKVIANGIDVNRIRAAENTSKKYDFLLFGWEFLRKGVDLALKACEQLEKNGYSFTLAVIGCENVGSPIMEKKWLKILGSEKDVNEIYADSRIFLHISRAEWCSYALQEAIYAGLPVICSDISENRFAHAAATVYMVKNEDENGIYTTMKKFLDNEITICESDIEQARNFINENYGLDRWIKDIITIYTNAKI